MLSELTLENKGENSGIMIGTNSGTVNLTTVAVKVPSLISIIVKDISAFCGEESDDDSSKNLELFTPEEKLNYNKVIKYREIIENDSIYFPKCDYVLALYDNANIGKKAKILKCIKNWYSSYKGELLLKLRDEELSNLEKVQNNSDWLIDCVKNKIYAVIEKSGNYSDTSSEELDLGITCFVCYCFMQCKILERPI